MVTWVQGAAGGGGLDSLVLVDNTASQSGSGQTTANAWDSSFGGGGTLVNPYGGNAARIGPLTAGNIYLAFAAASVGGQAAGDYAQLLISVNFNAGPASVGQRHVRATAEANETPLSCGGFVVCSSTGYVTLQYSALVAGGVGTTTFDELTFGVVQVS